MGQQVVFQCHRTTDTQARRGFTLIEIVVVMVILAIITGAVMANNTAGMASRALMQQASLVHEALSGLHRDTMLREVPRGVAVERESLVFFRWQSGQWEEQKNKLTLRYAVMQPQTLSSGSRNLENMHDIVFFSDGTYTAFSLDVTSEGEPSLVHQVTGDGSGNITLKRKEER